MNEKKINYQMLQVIHIVLLAVSLILYFTAPKVYSLQFCVHCAIVFVISASLIIPLGYRQSNSYINFDILFTIPFFYTNYVYSIFLYPINPDFSLFKLEFNEAYICKGAALATVAYCCYGFGRCIFRKAKEAKAPNVSKVKFKKLSSFYYFVALIFILFFLLPNLGKTYDEGSASYGIGDYVMALVMTLTYYILAVNLYNNKQSLLGIYKSDRRFYFVFAIIVAFFALEGARTFMMRFALVALFVYDLRIKRIKGKEAFMLLIAGFAMMAIIGLMRNGLDSSTEVISDNPVINAGLDLIINNRSLYVLMEYVDTHGCSYGQTMLMNLFSVVPFLQSLVFSVTGLSPWNTNSAYLVTDLYFSENVSEKIIGLGTNLVGDVYVMFGLLGLVIIMILLGRLISSLVEKIKLGDFMSILIYGMMICNAVYYVRSSILTPLRDVAWLLFVAYLCATIASQKRERNETSLSAVS